MLDQKLKDEFHAAEIMFKLKWMTKQIHCVVLVDLGVGLSIKPYYENEDEKELLIKDSMIEFGWNREMVLKDMAKPNYCLMFANPNCELEDIRKILTTGGMCLDEAFYLNSNPSCPFA